MDKTVLKGHTAGPWYVGAMNDALFVINEAPRPVPTDYVNTALKTKCIAKPTEPHEEGWTREEYEINAKLLAAAPDLLAECIAKDAVIAGLVDALKYLILQGRNLRSLPGSHDCGDHCYNSCPWCSARAALALAADATISQSNNGFVALEEATEPVINPELTDEILGWYADGRFSEEVKHRGQELAKELLSTRIQLRAAKLAYKMQNPQGISR